MNITVSGGGNIGTCFAVHAAEAGHSVTVFTSKPDAFSETLFETDGETGVITHTGEIHLATSDPAEAFSMADLVFLTVPAFLFEEQIRKMEPYLPKHTALFFVPGSGGGEGFAVKVLGKGHPVFGLQRVPAIARLSEYGKTVACKGYRKELFTASLKNDAGWAALLMEELFLMPCRTLPNYLNLTLTPSNPILHTARLYRLYGEGPVSPLFYEDWDDRTSKILMEMDGELNRVKAALPGIDLSGTKSLMEHYECHDEKELTEKISHIPAFSGIRTPGPDSRYFHADFSFGLSILLQIAELSGTAAPKMQEVMSWYRGWMPNEREYRFSDVSIRTKEDLIEFYGNSATVH